MFVLSAGSDPFGAFQRFAAEMGYKDKILAISLGQGQGPVAAKLIEQGTANGHWVFLQVMQTVCWRPFKNETILELPSGYIVDVSHGKDSTKNCRR